MNVRNQTIVIIALVSLCLIGGLGFFSQAFILEGFVELEEEILLETIDRTFRTIDLERKNLMTTVLDWSMWDDSYYFVQGMDPDYSQRNLDESVFEYLNLHYIVFTGIDGTIVYARGYDAESHEDLDIPSSLLLLHDSLIDARSEEISGFIRTEAGSVLVGIQPILLSSGEGPATGTLLFGRLADESWVDHLSEQMGIPLIISEVDEESFPLLIHDHLVTRDPDSITGSRVVYDLFDDPLLVLTATQDRSIYRKGLLSYHSALIAIIGFGLISGILLYLLINRSILKRISALNKEVQEIGEQSLPRGSVRVQGEDEVTELARSINSLLDSMNQMLRSIEKDQKVIRENEERYRLLFNVAVDPMLLVALDLDDKPGIILDANESVLTMLHISRDELIGLRLSKVFSIDDDGIEPGNPFILGHFHPSRLHPIPIEVSMHSFLLGNRPAAIWIARDISERVRIEEERQASVDQLSHNIEQFAILGDNIRNPLQVIRGYLSLFEDRTEYVEMIEDQIEQIDARIKKLDEGWLESDNVIKFLRRNRK